MDVSIKTEVLQKMVAKATKGVGNNKLIPLTSLACVSVENGVLTLTTTDMTNYLYVRQTLDDAEDFYAVVPFDVFSKLVARMTCASVTLSVQDGKTLRVYGNGDYSIELPADENGHAITYPNPLGERETEKFQKIDREVIDVMLNTIKPALATTLELPCYTGCYVGNTIVGTDTFNIACWNYKLVKKPILISAETLNLLSVVGDEEVKFGVFDDAVVFISDSCTIYSAKMAGIEDYSYKEIMELVNTQIEHSVTLNKTALLQSLDRLALFVSPYDKNGITMSFQDGQLQLSSKSTSGVETIPYSASDNFENFECMIDIDFLETQLKAQTADSIQLFYGAENCIKMVDGNLTQVVALMEDSEA